MSSASLISLALVGRRCTPFLTKNLPKLNGEIFVDKTCCKTNGRNMIAFWNREEEEDDDVKGAVKMTDLFSAGPKRAKYFNTVGLKHIAEL